MKKLKNILTITCLISLIIFTSVLITSFAFKKNTNENKYIILVSIDDSRLYVFRDNILYKSYPISPGKPSTPTPVGTFKIISKAKWGEGFGGRWMGLNVKYGKYGIHGTYYEQFIGSHVSKGCIRMMNDHVKELYSYIPIGTLVIIFEGSFGPFRNGFRTIYPGDTGEDVMEVQRALKNLGYYYGEPDGKYGKATEYALYQFLKKNNLKITNKITPYIISKLGITLFE